MVTLVLAVGTGADACGVLAVPHTQKLFCAVMIK